MGRLYRVGIVGSGFGVNAHLPAFRAHPAFEVIALASPHRAPMLAKENGIANAYSSCAQMVSEAPVDVVSIASPPFAHCEDVLAALAAEKHVICEKPFALNVAQAQTMVEAARRSDRATAVMHEFRWIPQRMAIKELVANGHLCPLRNVEITQLSGRLRADVERDPSWWFDGERGGGMAGALLSHLIDAANWVVGRAPIRSTGYLRTANPTRRGPNGTTFESTVDDGCFALADYGDGLIARLSVDATNAVDSFTMAVHAENRTAVASGPDVIDLRLFSVDADETSELECKPPRYRAVASSSPNAMLIMELLDEFVRQIETGRSDVPTFAEALETQRVLASIGYG